MDYGQRHAVEIEAAVRIARALGAAGHRIQKLDLTQIVRLALELGVDPAMTVSCYQPDAAGRACGVCDACRIRRAGFEVAGVVDSTRYTCS